jgi:hypothetical protein
MFEESQVQQLKLALPFIILGALFSPCVAKAEEVFSAPPIVAQAPFTQPRSLPDTTIIPTDQTPTRIGEERELLSSQFKAKLLERLPARVYFNAVTEASQRFESNVFNNKRTPRRDYVFRILPNVTLGYNLFGKTSVYANYFMIKDVFANTPALNQSTFHSVSGGILQNVPIGQKSNLQLNMQIRQLFQARNFRQADMLPGITFTRFVNQNRIVFSNVQLQLRSRNIFQGATREIDPFYTIGLVERKGPWAFSATGTLVNNFRQRDAVPPISNSAIICDFELARPLPKLPGVDVFLRAEPIWNWGARGAPGLSGFDFRLFSGLRLTMNKPAINSEMSFLRKQLEEAEQNKSNN